MFIGRREDGTIYGAWTVRQWERQEEVAEDDAELVAFVNRTPPASAEKSLDERVSALEAKTRTL